MATPVHRHVHTCTQRRTRIPRYIPVQRFSSVIGSLWKISKQRFAVFRRSCSLVVKLVEPWKVQVVNQRHLLEATWEKWL